MSAQPVRSRVVRCPGCGSSCVYSSENPYRPFCSARCKNYDFGAWASESFSVEAELPDVDADIEPASPRTKHN